MVRPIYFVMKYITSEYLKLLVFFHRNTSIIILQIDTTRMQPLMVSDFLPPKNQNGKGDFMLGRCKLSSRQRYYVITYVSESTWWWGNSYWIIKHYRTAPCVWSYVSQLIMRLLTMKVDILSKLTHSIAYLLRRTFKYFIFQQRQRFIHLI